MQEFIFKLDKHDAAALGAVRCIGGLQAAQDEHAIWLRGIADPADTRLRQLPIKTSFVVDTQQNLFVPGGLTPVDTLKGMSWQALTSFLPVEAPVSALPGKTGQRITIKLIPSAEIREGAALLCSLAVWKAYAETAPGVRLALLRFAVSDNNEVLIAGHPLPPLPGKEYWLTDNILLPCGYDFELPMVRAFIAEKINPHNDSIILFDTAGRWQVIGHSCFVEAKRSAARLTKGNTHD